MHGTENVKFGFRVVTFGQTEMAKLVCVFFRRFRNIAESANVVSPHGKTRLPLDGFS
jgi:hypothetical protein